MLNNIKGIGFDLDGTLVDSLSGLTYAVNTLLKTLNLPQAAEEQVESWIGNGVTILIKRALEWANHPFTQDEVARYCKAYSYFYTDALEKGHKLYPGVAKTLATLHEQQIKMAIITNKPSQFVQPLLEHLKIAHYFQVTLGGDDVVIRKPHPAPIYQTLGQLGLRTNEFLFVGDSSNDIEAAKAALCPSIGLTYGYNYHQPIALSEPDYIFDNFSDILSVLDLSVKP